MPARSGKTVNHQKVGRPPVTQFLDDLRQLGAARLAALAASLALTVALMAWLALAMTRSEMALLYGGLEPSVAGEVMRKLEELKVAHEVRGDAIMVPAGERDRVRMVLADTGLPRRGQAGYELLDQLGRFGTTSDMFDAAYWRAKEGELARTVDSLSNVRDARVHLVPMSRELFSRSPVEPSASVTVTAVDGGPLNRRQAQAIRHLVALGVKGLRPERVTVIDTAVGVVLGPDHAAGLASDGMRDEREQQLQARIEDMLAAHVGHGRVRVNVAVDLDHEAESVSERVFDPASQVAIHTDTTEVEESSSGSDGEDAVSVATNLPNQGAGEGGRQSARTARTESREVANFEVSEVRRDRRREAGAVRRISVAVLMGGVWSVGEAGERVWRPQSTEELARIEDLVKSAIGFDSARGDQLTVQSLPFHDAAGTSAADVAPDLWSMVVAQLGSLAQAAAVVLIGLLAFWFLARPVLAELRAVRERQERSSAEAVPTLEDAGAGDRPRLGAGTTGGSLAYRDGEAPSPHEQAVATLVEAVDRYPEQALGTLRRWLNEVPERESAA